MNRQGSIIKMKSVTPLHFGSGDSYVPGLDYMGKILIDANGVMNYLKQDPLLLNKMTAAIEGNKLAGFIEDNRKNLPGDFFRQMIAEEEPRGEIRAHIKTGFGQPYVPGSALKGSIRTSIIKSLSRKTDITPLIKETLTTSGTISGKFADQKTTGPLLNRHPRNDAKYNLMKILRISDSEPITRQSEIKKLKIYNSSKGYLFVEVIPPETETIFSLSIDPFFNKQENRSKIIGEIDYDFSDLIGDINESSLNIVSYHKTYSIKNKIKAYSFLAEIMKNLKGNQALINLGYGIGWPGMTGNLLGKYFNTLNDNDKIEIKKKLKLNPYKHTGESFPITRRFVINKNNEFSPLGWAVLTFPENSGFKQDWRFTTVPDCTDYLNDIEGASFAFKDNKKQTQHLLGLGIVTSATIIKIDEDKKLILAEANGVTGRINIKEVANQYVHRIHDHLQEGMHVNIKVISIKDGKFGFSIKQAK